MPNKNVLTLALAAVMATGLASCAKEEAYSSLPPSESAEGPKVVEATPQVQRVADTSSSGDDGRLDSDNILNERLVFFDFDKSDIRPEFRAMLAAHADYLVSNRNAAVILEGHADERGSTEYNLALGQRRSDSVRELMVASGVYADQIEAISYGEERPRSLGSTEASWADNRRVEIIYTDE